MPSPSVRVLFVEYVNILDFCGVTGKATVSMIQFMGYGENRNDWSTPARGAWSSWSQFTHSCKYD